MRWIFCIYKVTVKRDENKSMQLYYWQNETKTGNAEVDFITIKNKQVVPVEVKSRIKGGMKSLKVYFETHPNTKIALKISEGQFAKQDHLQEIPLYAIAYWLQPTFHSLSNMG